MLSIKNTCISFGLKGRLSLLITSLSCSSWTLFSLRLIFIWMETAVGVVLTGESYTSDFYSIRNAALVPTPLSLFFLLPTRDRRLWSSFWFLWSTWVVYWSSWVYLLCRGIKRALAMLSWEDAVWDTSLNYISKCIYNHFSPLKLL